LAQLEAAGYRVAVYDLADDAAARATVVREER
jgi:hypothetical protein